MLKIKKILHIQKLIFLLSRIELHFYAIAAIIFQIKKRRIVNEFLSKKIYLKKKKNKRQDVMESYDHGDRVHRDRFKKI